MKKFEEQVNIFNLDILEPELKKDRNKVLQERKARNKLFLKHTLKVSEVLDKECKNCQYSAGDNNRIKCMECPFYKILRDQGKELEKLTEHKIHKEDWKVNKADRNDYFQERLYTYDNLSDLEKDLEKDNLAYLRESHSLEEIAEMLDCEYKVLRSYVNKHKLNKRPDGTYYKIKND